MTNEKTEPTKKKKKRGRPPIPNAQRKKRKKAGPVSEKTKKRKSRLRPDERERYQKHLLEHFGASILNRALLKANKMPEVDEVLIELKSRMEKEIELQEREVADYLQEIDKEYRKVGRPRSVFNWKECEYLCSIGCTAQEIAGFFQVAEDTLRARIKEEYDLTFSEYYERHSQGIKVALRRKQLAVALEGDTPMLKFLGKNILGQKDQVDFDGQVKVNSWVDLVNNLGDGNESELPEGFKKNDES